METVRKAIVTGASRGIGRGIALCLAREGYDLAVSYYSKPELAMTLSEEIKKTYGRNCFIFQADFQSPGVAEKFIFDAVKALDGVDLLVNNGMKPVLGGSVLDLDESVIDGMLNSYLRSTFLMTREVARYMVRNNKKGNIINITSGRADRALPRGGLYGGLKAAINHATRSFALDLAPYGIRVNCVAPGYIKVRTREEYYAEGWDKKSVDDMVRLEKMVPLGRAGKPEEIGEAVAWVASEKASYMTGAVLTVDGALFLPGMPEETPNEGEELLGLTYFKRRSGKEWTEWN